MKIETFKKPVRIHTTSFEGKEKSYVKKGIPLVRFESYKNPFLMREKYCMNPECDCNITILNFMEINEKGIPINKPIYFTIFLDLKTWQENQKSERSKVSQCLIEEFLQGLTNEMKDSFKGKYREIRHAVKFEMPVDKIENGEMVAYSEVFGNTGSVVYGGRGASFRFDYNGKIYFIDDLYCINPGCRCKEVLLVFLEFLEETKVISCVFEARWSFKNKLEFEIRSNCTKDDAKKIFKEWQKSESDILDLLKERYEQIKDIGHRLISKNDKCKGISKDFPQIQIDEKKKIGRNDPCLCGSGKKYKRCCGR